MKKKKLMKIKKRLDKLETTLFFHEKRINVLWAKTEPKIDAFSIAKMDKEDAVKRLKQEGYTDGVTFWLPVVGMCGPMSIREAVEYIHKHVICK